MAKGRAGAQSNRPTTTRGLTSSPSTRGFQLLRRLEQQLRFAVHRPGNPVASPRSHGVPRRDVPGRVHIGMVGVSAGSACEPRLALTRLRIHMPACRAPLTGEGGPDLFDPSGCLFLQTPRQQSPARPQDLAVQSGFGANVTARIDSSSSGRTSHLTNLQVLNADHVEATGDVGTGLLSPVLTPVGLTGAHPSNGEPYMPPSVGAAPGTGELAFQTSQPALLPQSQAGRLQQLTCRQCRADCYAAVYTDHLAVTRRLNGIGNGSKGNMPASGPIHGYPVRLHLRWHRPGPADSHPTNLWHPDFADMTGQAAYVPLGAASPYDAESLISLSLTPGRPPSRTTRVKERSQRSGKVPQRLLLDRLGSVGQPGVLRPRLGELPTLLQVAWRARPARMPVRVLLYCKVPHVPGMGAVLAQHSLLGGRGAQPISRHPNTLAITTDIPGR